MDLDLHPMGKPKPCDVKDCASKEKCMLHDATAEGVEKGFTPKLTPKMFGEMVITCHNYETGEAPASDEPSDSTDE